jgi:carboxylesterase type B
MEKISVPNLGLWDQRASLQWLHDYIHLLGGDKTKVSAWGESAGAGSIYHHLVGFSGTQDPLFSKAFLQSPAFQALYDRKGKLEDTFQFFAKAAGCPGGQMRCLRAADTDTLRKANIATITSSPPGDPNMGPSADGTLIRQLPSLEFLSGIALLRIPDFESSC